MLASWEGIGPNGFNRAYDDPTGNCTIGIGHLVHLGPCTPAELARVYSSDELVSLHERDVEDHSRQIGDFIGFDLLQTEYDALVIFSFQQGSGGLGEPKNQGILEAIAVGPEVWDLDHIYLVWSSRYTSKAPPPIIRRRAAEALLFTTGTYTIN